MNSDSYTAERLIDTEPQGSTCLTLNDVASTAHMWVCWLSLPAFFLAQVCVSVYKITDKYRMDLLITVLDKCGAFCLHV